MVRIARHLKHASLQPIASPNGLRLRSAVGWLARANTGASAVAQSLLTQIAVLCISVGSGVVSARTLGATGRGELAAIVLWPQVFAGLFAFGIPAALIYHARRTPREERTLFFVALAISAVASVAMLVTGALSIPLALKSYHAGTVRDALLYLLVAPQVLVAYVLSAHLQVRGRFSELNRFRFVPASVSLLALAVLASMKLLTPPIAAACYLLPPLPIFAIVFARIVADLDGFSTNVRHAFGKLLSYSMRAAGIDLLGTLSMQVDQLMVVSFLSATSMGAYVVALSVSRVPNVVVSAMQQVVSPRAAALEPRPLTELVGRCTRVAIAATVAAGLALGAILPYVLPHLFGHDFARSVAVARVLLAELVLTGTATLLAESFKGIGRPGAVTLLQAFSLATSVLLLFILVPRFGLLGAGFALLAAAFVRLATLLALYTRIVGTPPPSLLFGTSDVRFVYGIFRSKFASGSR